MAKWNLLSLVSILCAALSPLASGASGGGSDAVAHVTRDGATFTVEAEFSVAASPEEVWDVITDFDRMAQILMSVDASKIVSRNGNVIQVEQKSHSTAGPLRLSMDSLREISLTPPKELRSRLIKGDVKSSDFTTRVIDEGGGITKVSVSGKFVAGTFSSGFITPESVQAQTRQQYQELREEILRRKAKEPPPQCLIAKNCAQGSS
jgi:carbon monoxide dehydrogenase subunit G